MAFLVRNGSEWPAMDGNDWPLSKMAGNNWKWVEMARNGLNG